MANLNDILKAAQAAQQQQRQTGFTSPAQTPVQTPTPTAQPQTQATGIQSILDRARQVQQQQRQTTGVQTTVPRTVTPTPTPTPVTTPTTTTQPTSRLRSVLEALGIASAQAQRAATGSPVSAQQQVAESNRIAELLAKPKQEVPATPFKSDKPKTVDTVKSWAGRDKLVQELNEIDTNSGYITDEQQANAVEARRREIISRLEAGDDKAGNAPQKYTDFERIRNIFGGATGQSLAGTVNAAGTLLDASYHAADTNEYAGWAVDPVSAQNIGYEHDENKLADRRFVEDAAKALEANADNMGGTASTDLERAKRGLGSLGQAGVDIATNVIQMGYDAALGGLTPMFIRTFGSSAQEARQKGADINQQMLYGTTKAAIEVGTEKLFDGLAGIFGKGAADDIVEGAIRKLTKNNTGRTLLRVVAGAAGEGGEEVISDLLAPLAETIINDETLQSLFFDKDGKLFKGSYSLDGSEVLYDFLIGAAIGGLGSVTSIATGQNAAKNAELRAQDAVEARVNQQMDGVMDALLGRARAVQAEQRAEAQAPVVQPTETLQNTNTQETPVQATESISPATDESVPSSTQKLTPASQEELNNRYNPDYDKSKEPVISKEGQSTISGERNRPTERGALSGSANEKATDNQPRMGEHVPRQRGNENASMDSTLLPENDIDVDTMIREYNDAHPGLNNELTTQQIDTARELMPAYAPYLVNDPIERNRFAEGQAGYDQIPAEDRALVMNLLFPDGEYYVSDGKVLAAKTPSTTTGQSTAFGDMRTGSNHRAPKYKSSPKSNVPAPQASSASFDPQTVKAGDKFNHKTWGEVTVTDVQNGKVTVELPDGDTKTVVQTNMGNFFTPVQQVANNAVPHNESHQNSTTEQSQTATRKSTASNRITSFRGEHSFLSNFADSPIGPYKNAEAAFQAAKCVNESDRKKFEGISAKEAKRLGRQVKLRPDWEKVKFNVMLDVVRQKFNNNPSLAQKLLATGDAELVEGNTWGDTTWGVNANTGEGQNALGKILMQVREELRSNAPVQQSAESGTTEKQGQTGRSEHHAAARSVEEANRALKEIEHFKQNRDYRGKSYSSAEDAQAAVNKTVNDLRNAGLTDAGELRNQAQELRKRSKEAQRMVDKIEALTPEGEDITDPDYNYWYDEVDAAENEAYALDEVADFIEANPESFAGQQAGTSGSISSNKQNGGTNNGQNGSGESRSDSPVEDIARRNEENPREERQNDARRKNPLVDGKSSAKLESKADYDAAKDRQDRIKLRHDRGQATVESEIELDGGEVIDLKYAPGWVKRGVEKAQSGAPDCRFVIATKTQQIAYYSRGNGTIVVNPGRLANWALSVTKKTGVPHSAANAILHERVHYWFEQSDYKAAEIFKYILSDFANDTEAQTAIQTAYEAHKNDYHKDYSEEYKNISELQDALWEEVIADLHADLPRAFAVDGKVSEAYDRIKASADKYIQDYVVSSYRINNGLDIYNGKPTSGNQSIDGGSLDPGANKSWADSLTAQEAPAENDSLEREDDDMTPLNEMDQEREEERRKEQRKETEKRFGKENHKRLSDAYETFKKWADEFTNKFGTDMKDEKGHKVKDEKGNPVKESMLDDFVKNVKDMLDGEMSVQSFQQYYESLKPAEGENKGTDENYFYDDVIAAYLNQFANAERTDNLTNTGADAEIARDEYLKQAEAFARVFEARAKKLSENFDNRTEMNAEVTENAEREVGGKESAKRKLVNWFKRIQSRPDLFFESLGGFNAKSSKVLYEIANRAKTGEKKLTNVRMGARQFFYDINSNPETAKAWRDMENGTTKGNVDIMGLGKVSLNYELAILKTLETNGAIDHIAENGAEFPNEADYYAGRNNNGWGDTDHLKVKWTPEALEQMARENLQKSQMMDDLLGSKPQKITFKDIQEEKVRILKDLRKQLKSDVMSSEIGRAAYEASVKSMQFMADEINDVTLSMYGIARALQGPNYWPMMVVGRGNNAQIMNNLAFNVEASSFLQHRKGGSGALHIVPFTEAMNNYITQASNFVAFGDLSSDLMMMSKEIGVGYGTNDSQKQSIQSVIKKEAGKGAAEYLTKWMETINGKPRDVSKFGTKMRSNLAQSSLLLNLGVAIKQTPSYFNAMGVIDPDILIKNRLMTFGALRSAKSYANNPLIQALNSKTNVLSSRKVGYNTVEMGEAIANGRSLSNKIMGKVPTWMTNWINKMDYRTVADLALACGEQVKRNNPNLDTKSDEFYQKTADLLEEAVVKTQPIYDAQFRPEYLRSDNEIVRMLSMFRTQQSQNYNNLVEAWGEYQAAKNGDAETKQAAETKLKNVVAGQAVSTLAFSLLSIVARLVTHRTKDYEDEEGNFDFGKLAKRAGLDFLESAAAVVWFGDIAAKVAVDIGSNLGAKAVSAVTGNKVSGTNEFFSVSDNTISLINTFASSAIALAKNPTSPKAIKNAIFDGSQAAGIPTRNAYNLLNSVVMYGYDAIGKNNGNYDDMIDMWVTEGKMSDATRATRTTEAAVKFYAKGDRNKANTLLGTLDYSNSDVMSSVKKALGAAYVDGDLSEDEYRRVLKNYVVPTTGDKIDDIIHEKNVDKAVAEYTENDPRKYNALIKAIDAAKKKTGNTSKSDAVARLIIDSAMEKNGRDAFMEKYTTSSYWTAYKAAEKQTGSPNRAVEALLGIDKNKDDTFSQDELYKFYLDNPKNFHLVQAIWDANDWSTSWNDFYQSKSRRLDYDRMASEKESVTTFAEAEAKLKELQSGARITLQKTDVDREMFDTILDLDMSDEDTDTTVNRYLSSGNRNNYNTLRGAGQSPEKSIEILKGIDTDEKGTISQKEMWAYYKAHPEDEAAIEALFNAQGYTGKTTKNWATFKKAKH